MRTARGSSTKLLRLSMLALLCFAGLASASERWDALRSQYFGEREILDGSRYIELDAPERAHDASTVPIVIHSLASGQRVTNLHLFVDMNPLPLAGVFRFSERASGWKELETRVRINEYTDIRAIAELEDGSLRMVSRYVKASGGCSAPALSDQESAMARAGQIRLLLDEISRTPEATLQNPLTDAMVKVSHPNNSGMQFDQISRNYIPAYFVHTIEAAVDGEPLMSIDTNFSLSENPSVRLRFPAGTEGVDSMSVSVLDSKGGEYQQAMAIE